jgi:hypothetical protein
MQTDSTVFTAYERSFGPFVHMSQEEKAIWVRFLQQGGTKYSPFIYDVRVGQGTQMPEGSSTYAVKSAYALTTKRIDVVYFENGNAVIVEVKRRAGLSAVGQLIGYRDLFRLTPDFNGQIAMLLVTDTLQPDMRPILADNNISFYEVGL